MPQSQGAAAAAAQTAASRSRSRLLYCSRGPAHHQITPDNHSSRSYLAARFSRPRTMTTVTFHPQPLRLNSVCHPNPITIEFRTPPAILRIQLTYSIIPYPLLPNDTENQYAITAVTTIDAMRVVFFLLYTHDLSAPG